MKSGERTDNANGQIQDRLNIFNGSNIPPPTHHKTNKFCDSVRGTVLLPYEHLPATSSTSAVWVLYEYSYEYRREN